MYSSHFLSHCNAETTAQKTNEEEEERHIVTNKNQGKFQYCHRWYFSWYF